MFGVSSSIINLQKYNKNLISTIEKIKQQVDIQESYISELQTTVEDLKTKVNSVYDNNIIIGAPAPK
jgi:septation ring formation regulator EzrA